MSGQLIACAFAVLASAAALYLRFFLRQGQSLPPGPKAKLISGNVHQLRRPGNSSELWKTLTAWSKEYGSPIIYWRIFGKIYIALNDFKTVTDLLESRASIYSDRPSSWFYHHLMERGLSMFNISSQHPNFKAYRRLLQGSLNPKGVREYKDIQEHEMRVLLRNLVSTPENFVAHFRRNAGAVILRIAYGWTVTTDDDRFVAAMEKGLKISFAAARPGQFIVDILPFLRFLPSWFPGVGFKHQAEVWRRELDELDGIPYSWAKEQMTTNNFKESFVSRHLVTEDGHPVGAHEDEIVRWSSLALYAGGADTTVSAITSFIIHMMRNPDIQKKAQDEVDKVLGKSRLPTVDDEVNFPYVTAVLKEVLRATPVTTLGLPHRVLRDDEYAGYHIPGGATVISNIWAIMHDENLYPDPDSFNPERFTGNDPQMDPRKIAFGFGRRVCPGAHFAEVSLLLNLAAILATFDIEKPRGAAGIEYDPDIEYVSQVTSHPKPFECRIVPRSHTLALLNQEADD